MASSKDLKSKVSICLLLVISITNFFIAWSRDVWYVDLIARLVMQSTAAEGAASQLRYYNYYITESEYDYKSFLFLFFVLLGLCMQFTCQSRSDSGAMM